MTRCRVRTRTTYQNPKQQTMISLKTQTITKPKTLGQDHDRNNCEHEDTK